MVVAAFAVDPLKNNEWKLLEGTKKSNWDDGVCVFCGVRINFVEEEEGGGIRSRRMLLARQCGN